MNQSFFRKPLIQSLFTEIDNSGLIVFRVIFGLLIFLESAGAIATGWVKETFVEPAFTFSFIDFEWLQPLPGNGMYFYYAVMSLFGLAVMVGWHYRVAMGGFTLMWTMSYLMQKSHYNNHYYLLILLCFLMLLIPAHRYFSLDVKRKPSLKKLTCPRWCYGIFFLQIGIVFTYASIAKLYPDWLDGTTIGIWFGYKSKLPVIGPLLAQPWIIPVVVYGGIFYDLLITPMLLWKKTRVLALIVSLFFHGFNSAVFHIGIFPYLMIGMTVLFFPPEKIRKIFLKKKPALADQPTSSPVYPKKVSLWMGIMTLYFLLQILLPLRHHLYEGNVLWTEEGHRMSWRMMLRSKSGNIYFELKDPVTKATRKVYPSEFLSGNQVGKVAIRPDMIWQAVQYLKEQHKKDGIYPEIYVHAMVSLNGRPVKKFIDPTVNMAEVPWKPFEHASWILPFSPTMD
ncbi:HTTM domain-containing protein [Fulvivirgaceae bacterium BMA12]|uniref:HTTM domain-containing protein n=1 Tax=Agaribacillus aureus TaxID=3051825 RepID=A0ABT8KZ21_9BACT|nr:HTTM domain-containing protein [Fulvivirgaceae bacterium BMA12]